MDVDKLKKEWDTLDMTDWTRCFGEPPPHAVGFWEGVLKYRRAGGEAPYAKIALFALRVLSLPISNAVVERAFSYMNAIKVKARNWTSMELLGALI